MLAPSRIRSTGCSLLAATLLALAGPASATADNPDVVERVLRQRLEGDRTGACMQAALIDGEQVRRAAFCARPGPGPGPDAAFEIGSVSKTMLAALVAGLVERGTWSLDDPIARHLPPGTAVPRQGERQILVRDLLTHSAGLPPLPPTMRPARADDPYAGFTEDQLLAALAVTPLSAPIGSRAQYSNYGAMLLSLAVARAQGGDLERALRDQLFAPLGMTGSHIQRAPAGQVQARGHLPSGVPTAPWTITPSLAGVGMVRAPLADLVRYAQALLQPPATPLGAALRRTQQPLAHGFAMHWVHTRLGGTELLLHEGGTGGFSSAVVLVPQKRQAVVLVSDTALADLGGLGDVALALLGLAPAPQPPRRDAPLPDALARALPGTYELGGLTMRLELREGRLFARVPGQAELELFADSRGDLYPREVSALMTPVLRDGRVDRFSWRQGGGLMEARRTDAPRPASARHPAWQAWAGTYRLLPGMDLRVFEQDGRLMMQATGQGAFEVETTGEDEVAAPVHGIRARFRRNAQGEVVGMAFSQRGQTLEAPRQ